MPDKHEKMTLAELREIIADKGSFIDPSACPEERLEEVLECLDEALYGQWVHMAHHYTFGGIVAECGAAMTRYGDEFVPLRQDPKKFWGSLVPCQPIDTLTFNSDHVTCPDCLKAMRRLEEGSKEHTDETKGQ